MVAAGEDAPMEEEAKAHSVASTPVLQSSTYFTSVGSSGLNEM